MDEALKFQFCVRWGLMTGRIYQKVTEPRVGFFIAGSPALQVPISVSLSVELLSSSTDKSLHFLLVVVYVSVEIRGWEGKVAEAPFVLQAFT